jgi:exopolyphosphatase/guanosine-5'-triphosphate,3'-diphosphate pyrophosphatase
MRLGVLDVGSNTVHLLVVDAYPGAHPLPAFSHKAELHLAEHLDDAGQITPAGHAALLATVQDALRVAEDQGCEEVLGFATSAIREAPNGEAVLDDVRTRTGADLQVLSGQDEARLTFLAVRRWFGWSSGRLLVLDIGGGSLEIGAGGDEEPAVAVSLPLGAGRLTRERLRRDPPTPAEVSALESYVESALDTRELDKVETFDRAAATSKTFRTLARLAGAPPSGEGLWAPRELTRTGLHQVRSFIQRIPSSGLAELDGVSPRRAHQLLAGAVVAEAAMNRLNIDTLHICPWALREGVILRRLDQFPI